MPDPSLDPTELGRQHGEALLRGESPADNPFSGALDKVLSSLKNAAGGDMMQGVMDRLAPGGNFANQQNQAMQEGMTSGLDSAREVTPEEIEASNGIEENSVMERALSGELSIDDASRSIAKLWAPEGVEDTSSNFNLRKNNIKKQLEIMRSTDITGGADAESKFEEPRFTPRRKPSRIQRAVGDFLQDEQGKDPLVDSFSKENSDDLPIVGTNVSSRNVREGTITEGQYFPGGPRPDSMLGSLLIENHGTRYVDQDKLKELINVNNNSAGVVTHEITHSTIAKIKKSEGKSLDKIINKVRIGSTSINQEDYTRLFDAIRLGTPDEQIKKHFKRRGFKKSPVEILKMPQVLNNMIRLQELADEINIKEGKPGAFIHFKGKE